MGETIGLLGQWVITPVDQNCDIRPPQSLKGFLCGSADKESTCNVGDLSSIPGLGRPPGERKGYPLQYSDLENSMDCRVHGVSNSWTWLSDFHIQSLKAKSKMIAFGQFTDFWSVQSWPGNHVAWWKAWPHMNNELLLLLFSESNLYTLPLLHLP